MFQFRSYRRSAIRRRRKRGKLNALHSGNYPKKNEHMKKTIFLLSLALLWLCNPLKAQLDYEFKGYISNMQSVQFVKPTDAWTSQSQLHNRLNFKLFMGEHFSLKAEMRNRILWGTDIETYPDYARMAENETGWMDLSAVWFDGTSAVGISTLDRLSLSAEFGKFKLDIGRQRINWGRTYVWNPNNLFNSYSFFDFDYVERPGADALRLQFFPSATGQIEFAAKLDSTNRLTAAAYWLGHLKEYDLQLLAGIVNNRDYAFGLGWSGNIGSVGFKGEASYLHPKDDPENDDAIMISTGLEYMFKNQLMLRGEYFYNSAATGNLILSNIMLSATDLRDLSFSKNSIFIGVDYPITPLLNGSLGGMYMPERNGFFVGPSLSYSLAQNFDLSVVGQFFHMNESTLGQLNYTMLFAKLQWSF